MNLIDNILQKNLTSEQLYLALQKSDSAINAGECGLGSAFSKPKKRPLSLKAAFTINDTTKTVKVKDCTSLHTLAMLYQTGDANIHVNARKEAICLALLITHDDTPDLINTQAKARFETLLKDNEELKANSKNSLKIFKETYTDKAISKHLPPAEVHTLHDGQQVSSDEEMTPTPSETPEQGIVINIGYTEQPESELSARSVATSMTLLDETDGTRHLEEKFFPSIVDASGPLYQPAQTPLSMPTYAASQPTSAPTAHTVEQETSISRSTSAASPLPSPAPSPILKPAATPPQPVSPIEDKTPSPLLALARLTPSTLATPFTPPFPARRTLQPTASQSISSLTNPLKDEKKSADTLIDFDKTKEDLLNSLSQVSKKTTDIKISKRAQLKKFEKELTTLQLPIEPLLALNAYLSAVQHGTIREPRLDSIRKERHFFGYGNTASWVALRHIVKAHILLRTREPHQSVTGKATLTKDVYTTRFKAVNEHSGRFFTHIGRTRSGQSFENQFQTTLENPRTSPKR